MPIKNRLPPSLRHKGLTMIIAILIMSFLLPIHASPAYALDVPLPIYPVNYSKTTPVTDPPLGIPSFYWSSAIGAKEYRLQVDSEADFNSPIFLDIITQNPTYTPQSTEQLLADGDWFWRVRVEKPNPIGDWSQTMHFTKTWATSENRPALLAPQDGASISFFDYPAFTWSPVLGSASYQFQIATTQDGFATPLLSVNTITTTLQPNNRLANGIYYWRVIPLDPNDQPGTSSNIQSFKSDYGTYTSHMVPALLEPVDESFPTFTPTFHWTAIIGAEAYRLEYTTSDTCDFSLGASIVTRQTYFTPTGTFPDEVRYCWHVRVESSPVTGDWNQTWHFQKRWNLQPILLTPTKQYQTGLYPLYSWTPVPGASRYLIQIAENPNFDPILEESITTNTTYAPQEKYDGTAHYWWRVRPIDGSGLLGVFSDVSDFYSVYTSVAPIQIYPLYYYPPNNDAGYPTNPYSDRTVPLPIFIWHRVMVPAPTGGVYAVAYRIQVDDSPEFSAPDWEFDTENTSASPTTISDFIPIIGQDYYWRVCPLNSLAGTCLVNSSSGLEWWSQIWKARFDIRNNLPSTVGGAPELLRPASGQEVVEATPLLEWWPLQGASQYQVEISRDVGFSPAEISETVRIPAYSPSHSLAQRSLNRTDYGTFYWRVRAYVSGQWSNWSNAWRFQIASQSEWRYTRSPGSVANQLLIGDDPIGDTVSGYDLSTLFASQSNTNWYLGFNANITTTNMTYVFYIDLDHIEGSGASSPPERNYHVTTIQAHQPEYAIYVDEVSSVINAQNIWIYAWDGDSWGIGQRLADLFGSVYTASGYIELQLPNASIGMNQNTSSASIILFSVDTTTGDLKDSVPMDPEVPGTAQLSRFSAVSERMNLIYPPSNVSGDPSYLTSVLPFYWDWPTGSNGATPFAGNVLQVDVEQDYSLPHEGTFLFSSSMAYLSENNITLLNDIVGDNIYYWRVQPRYWLYGRPEVFGAWASGWSFHRSGFTAQNLTTSITFGTPTFRWDIAEGADIYRLQVSTNPNFVTNVVDIVTPMSTYTPIETLAEGKYYWRVQINRFNNINNGWSEVKQLELKFLAPTGLTPNGSTIEYAPTMCWNPLVGNDHGVPVMTAWKYFIQVSQDQNFTEIYDSAETNNNCWTPTVGYHDGTFYWRVAMIDGNNRMGSYSPAASFTKLYPKVSLISPISGVIHQTPTFTWTSVNGAASYVVEVSLNENFSPLHEGIETINTQYTPASLYSFGRMYYWRVAIRDRNGRQGPFTDASFLIGTSNIYLPFISR